jgi:cysteine-S-conjugate beta-lyase
MAKKVTFKEFDCVIDRRATASVKYDSRLQRFGHGNVIPLWVADMDFATPSCVLEGIKKRLEHPVLGYTLASSSLRESIAMWQKKRHGWCVYPEWIEMVPGVVPALGFAVCTLSDPKDSVIVQSPVYFPFYDVISKNDRMIQCNPLIMRDGRYAMDLEHFQSLLSARTKLLLLCNPHNPGGSVWREQELRDLLVVCRNRGITIISDEIHGDLVYAPAKHIPIALLAQEYGVSVVTVTSAGKSFNIPGLNTAYMICEDATIRHRLELFMRRFHLNGANLLGFAATEAAYQEGEMWLESLVSYLANTMMEVKHMFETANIPITAHLPESTYLMWLDCRRMNLDDDALKDHMIHRAGVGLSSGVEFGTEGSGYMRMNIAMPQHTVYQAVNQIIASVRS